MKKLLVTGGTGYVGSVMVPALLDKGYEVTVLDNLMYGQASLLGLSDRENFSFVRGDARDERQLRELLPEVDAIIPLAAIVGAPACDRDPALAESLNLGAVKSLVKLRSKEQIIVFPTTNSGYGTKSGEVYWERLPDGKSHDIPYRCLVPRAIYGLLVPGRCASTTHIAQASTRVTGPCMAMGQAAGTAAALAVYEGKEPRELNVGVLQERLREQGADLG